MTRAQTLAETLRERYGQTVPISQAAAELLRLNDLLVRLRCAVEALDGTSVENERLVDDYRAVMRQEDQP